MLALILAISMSDAYFPNFDDEELETFGAQVLAARYDTDPIAWASEKAKTFLWSKQREIFLSVLKNRKTAVPSCHGPGKSFTAAHIVAWWLDSHPPGEAAVVTTAPSDRQVKFILWKEIRRVQSKAGLPGRTNQKEWYFPTGKGDEEIVAFGMKPADYDPEAFQGIHARYVLVVLDEAGGIPGGNIEKPASLWSGADSLLTNDDCRELAIGNPDDPNAEFFKVCKPGSGWNVIRISAWDTPNFTGEKIPETLRHSLTGRMWVEDKRKEWAPTWYWVDAQGNVSDSTNGVRCVPPKNEKEEDSHPLWVSKVLGKFPDNKQAMGLIPITWVEQALERRLEPSNPNELGVDMGAGGDASTTAHRRGPVVRIISEDHNPNTMGTTGKVVNERKETGATLVKIDKIGIGAGITDRMIELNEPVAGINVGEVSNDPEKFLNLKAELYWALRERFESGDIDLDPNDRATITELTSLRYKINSRGQTLVESKIEARKRGVPSPNRAEAIMLAFAPVRALEGGALAGKLTW